MKMTKSEALEFYEAIKQAENLREQAVILEDDALREAGWESTSSTPGSYLWKKEFDGKSFLVERSMALSLQQGEAFLAAM